MPKKITPKTEAKADTAQAEILNAALERVLRHYYGINCSRNSEDAQMAWGPYRDMMKGKYVTPAGVFKDPEALLAEEKTIAKERAKASKHLERQEKRKKSTAVTERY
jgi:hypothetical protein